MSQCIVCGGEGRYLGTLARGAWYECRQCGILWNETGIDDSDLVMAKADDGDGFDDSDLFDRLELDTEDVPDIDQLIEWEMDGVCEALDGCLVEPDGVCPHGYPSWLRHLGYC